MLIKNAYKHVMENGRKAILNSKIVSTELIYNIMADEGKLLTDGARTGKSFYVTEDEIDNYYEIDDEDYDAPEIEETI